VVADPWFGEFLTPGELRRDAGVRGVNSGFFCCSADEYARIMPLWADLYTQKPGPLLDQAALNALCVRGIAPARFLADELVAYPSMRVPLAETAIIEHFVRDKTPMYERFVELML
jgi:hypothetical protein